MRTIITALLVLLSTVVVGNGTLAEVGSGNKQMATSRPVRECRKGVRKPAFYPRVPRLEKGEFIFFPYQVVTETEKHREYFERLKSFRVCLTNGYWNFAPTHRDELHAEGCELFIYIWFNGFYEKEMPAADKKAEVLYMSGIWREIFKHPDWLLNADNPMKGGGAEYPAHFFDYTNPELRKFLVSFIKKRLDEVGYDGVFFDYIGSSPLPKEIKELWKTRYPNTTIFYEYCLAKMHNDISYASDWYASGFGQDDVYFLDLGDPLEESYRELDDVVVRYFENGFVLVTGAAGSIDFHPDGTMIPKGARGLWDIYEGARVWGWTESKPIAVNPTYYAASDSYYPASRVFMYLTDPITTWEFDAPRSDP